MKKNHRLTQAYNFRLSNVSIEMKEWDALYAVYISGGLDLGYPHDVVTVQFIETCTWRIHNSRGKLIGSINPD